MTATLLAAVALVASSHGQLVLLDGGGRVVRSLGPGESPAWSADGTRIAFVRRGDVFVVGADGRGLARVTRTAAVEESPDWSPDGALVYASNRGGRFALYVQRPGGPARQLTRPARSWQEDRSPAWSPDGRFVAFASNRPSAFDQELYLVRRDGGGLRRLTFTKGSDAVLADDGMPAWRPDGSGLVFVSNRDRNLELYALDLATLRTARLTRTGRDETLPRVGPGGRLAFVAASRIFVGARAIGPGSGVDWRPAKFRKR
jgi:TolB protein